MREIPSRGSHTAVVPPSAFPTQLGSQGCLIGVYKLTRKLNPDLPYDFQHSGVLHHHDWAKRAIYIRMITHKKERDGLHV